MSQIYPWLKALHVAAALAFVGGVLAVSVFLAVPAAGSGPRATTGHWLPTPDCR